jgi:xylulokinase
LPGKYILAHDVGTEANKAVLFDTEGKIIGLDSEVYGVNYPRPSWAEQDPEIWWRAIVNTTRRVMRKIGVSPSDVVALSLDAMMITALPVDRQGKALRPAIIWLDVRAGEQADWCLEKFDLMKLLEMGMIPPASEKDVIPKILWIKEKEPEIFNRTYKFIDVKDYLIYKCIGEFCTDWSCPYLPVCSAVKQRHGKVRLWMLLGCLRVCSPRR